MKDIKEIIIKQCLELISREDVKEEVKKFIRPMINLMMEQIYPYLFISIGFSFISFLLVLGIFILLLKNKKFVYF